MIVLSGPSVGKITVRSALFQMKGHDLVYSVSMTTRKPRENEVHGRNIILYPGKNLKIASAREKCSSMRSLSTIITDSLEPVQELLNAGKEVVLEIEVQGATQVREK